MRKLPRKGRIKTKATISKVIDQLDKEFSRQVRMNAADKDGMVACYTCGHTAHYKKIQNGHYVSRYYKAVRWDPDNCRPQCMMCNMWKRGDPVMFRRKLIEEIGVARVEAVEAKRFALFKEPLEYYQIKLAELLSHAN